MLSKQDFFKLKWLVAKNELANPDTTGSFSFQKSKSDSIFDIHARVSGLHSGFTAPRSKQIIDWIRSIDIDIIKIDQWQMENNNEQLPNIGVRWSEYEKTPMSDTVHCVYEFLYKHRYRTPVVFTGEYWYFDEIIDKKINQLEELTKDAALVISYPFMEQLQTKHDMNAILKKCCELDIPVMLDCIWLPLTNEIHKLENVDCIDMITHSVTKMLPLAGIKGGFCYYRKPLPMRMRHNEIHGKVGAYFLNKLIEQKGYWYVRDSHEEMQSKWCKILDLKKHDMVLAGTYDNGHELEEFGAKKNNPGNLFSLVPFYNHDQICTDFLLDKKLI